MGLGRTDRYSGVVARNETKDQKTTIRREAARLFAKQGYHATGIEDISQAVGLGRGALYHHIGSKEQLLFEISSLGLDELTAACQDIVDADMPASEKLRSSRDATGSKTSGPRWWKTGSPPANCARSTRSP